MLPFLSEPPISHCRYQVIFPSHIRPTSGSATLATFRSSPPPLPCTLRRALSFALGLRRVHRPPRTQQHPSLLLLVSQMTRRVNPSRMVGQGSTVLLASLVRLPSSRLKNRTQRPACPIQESTDGCHTRTTVCVSPFFPSSS